MRTKVLSEQEMKEIIKRLGKEFTNRFKDERNIFEQINGNFKINNKQLW